MSRQDKRVGFLRSIFTGSPDPLIAAAVEDHQFATDIVGEDWTDDVRSAFGLPLSGDSHLSPVARVSRRLAMQVPAVKRSRDLICGTLGGLPVDVVGPDKVTSPSWLSQPEADYPRMVTMTRTFEDLLFESVAWWKITEFAWNNYPKRIKRVDPAEVQVNETGSCPDTNCSGRVMMQGRHVHDTSVVKFDSPTDALLVAGARAIRTALSLDAAAARYADEPQPLGYLTPAENADPSQEEAQGALDAWHAASQRRVTGYIGAALKYQTTQFNAEQVQLADQRQHAVLEISRLTGIDPEDLGVSTTSRTYQNSQDRRKALLDFVLGQYRQAVEDRLSMGDVTPGGYVVKFNLSSFLRSDDVTRYTAYGLALSTGALTAPEIRALEDRPPLTEGEAPVAAPATESPTLESARAVVEFDGEDVAVTLDAPSAPNTFSVDKETRVIRGLAVPFGVISEDGRTYKFDKGSIQFGDPKRIKLLVAHDWAQAIGHATGFEETDEGLVASFKVARGAEGDRALSMAEDGVWDGLSVGIGRGMKTRLQDGVHHVTFAPLREISQTPCPAYDGARITEVAASAITTEGTTMADENTPNESGALDLKAVTDAISQGFADLSAPQAGRETVTPTATNLQITEPSPYRFDGLQGEHSLVEDMRSATQGNGDAHKRLSEFMAEAFAVTTGNAATLNPTTNRPDLYVPNLQFSRPLWESVSTGSITDRTPFTVPKFSSASGLVAAHTEGVEPTPGAFAASSQTVSPAPMSGKIEINREVLDQGGNPKVDAIIWAEMQAAYFEAIESRIATTLAAVGTAEVNFASAVNSALVNGLTGVLVGLQFVRGGNRFTRLVLDGSLFPALVNAEDTTGRKLLPVLGATNAQGQVSAGFDAVQVGNLTGRAAWALGTGNAAKSYLFVPTSVWAWASAPSRFDFEYQVKSVDLAIWGYSAAAVLRDSDVKPLDYTTADA